MTLHRQIIVLCLLLIYGGGTAFSMNYQKAFGDDWTQAEQFVREHCAEWKPIFEEFGVDADIAIAIVFPELIRYSKWQDEIETAAVNGLYVLQGTKGANFSIGRFQMKPSFAEEVEAAWNQSALAKEFGFVFNLQNGVEARRSRIRRLGTIEGQCRYLAIFIRLQFLRHPQLLQLQSREQAGFLATIYNRSFSTTWEQVCQLRHQKNFHTDMIVTRHTKRYCYADIAQAFYRSIF
jgi:hypothetical protein